MIDLLTIVLPIFGLIAIGYVARWGSFISERAGEGLSEFVFKLSLPCLIFRTLVRAEIPAVQPWGYWISYFVGVAVVWALAARHRRAASSDLAGVSQVVAGFSAGQANTVFVGVPMILKAYGEAGAVPLFLLIAVHLPVTMTLATILAEGRQASPLLILRRLVTHPIVVAIIAGSACRPFAAASCPLPLWQIVDLLGSAAVPCALISMGIALYRYGIAMGWKLPASDLGPQTRRPPADRAAARPLRLRRCRRSGPASRCCSPPAHRASTPILFAERYGEGVALASSSVCLSTVLALGSTLFWLCVLGVG